MMLLTWLFSRHVAVDVENKSLGLIIKIDDVLFNASDFCKILRANSKTKSSLPKYISFAEALVLCAQYQNFKLAQSLMGIIVNCVDDDLWKNRFVMSYECFIDSFMMQTKGEGNSSAWKV